jgi:flagellar assembly protein FliH
VSKNVFKSLEIIPTESSVAIETPDFKKIFEKEVEAQEAETYNGKTIDELKKEVEEFEKNFALKREEMLKQAEIDSREIIEKAEKESFLIFKKKNDEALEIKLKAEDEVKEIIEKAHLEAKNIESEISDKETRLLNEARKRGYQEGWEDGYKKGADEVKRLAERVQLILNSTIEKRNSVFVETEQQIINLVLLISKKVIKVISENQKNVVINNVVQALRKLKSRGDVAIRVNLDDLELTSAHKKDFIEMVEGVKSIRILEDTTVDRGGCIIETDFGSIDARISSQLHEIEERILELMPIQSLGKQENSAPV